MPSWRLAHHGKATAALRAVELGYHTAVMDLDVYLAEGATLCSTFVSFEFVYLFVRFDLL